MKATAVTKASRVREIGHDAAFIRAKPAVEIGDQIVRVFETGMDADDGAFGCECAGGAVEIGR